MISSTLYSKFPTISYNDQIVTNLTIRLKFREIANENIMAYYPYTIVNDERADTIAYRYYDDPSYTWLIYLANNIIDPHQEWPKSADRLDSYITEVYGSVERAHRQILYYRVDWLNDDTMLTPGGFASLAAIQKKYWVPVFNTSSAILYYERAKHDWVVESNKTISMVLRSSLTSDILVGDTLPVSIGDILYQQVGGSQSASAEVINVIESVITLKCVEGEFVVDASVIKNDQVIGRCNNVEVLTNSFAAEEAYYWAPVSAYDHEQEINESRKTILLIDKAYVDTIEREIRTLLTP